MVLNDDEFKILKQKIKNNLTIVHIIQEYVDLKKRGKNLTGTCPFCVNVSSLIVNEKMDLYKCFNCQKVGNGIGFIMAYEKISQFEAVIFILSKFFDTLDLENNIIKFPITGTIYVLELADNCYYIGYTNNLDRRLKHHFEGNGAVWTKKHKFIKLLETFKNKTLNYENFITEKYINKFGYNFVRGGDHLFFAKNHPTL